MSFCRSCRPGLARLALFLALAAFCLPVAAQAAQNAPEGGAADRARLEKDDPAARAEWNTSLRLDAEGRLQPSNRLKALRDACEMPVDPSMSEGPLGSFTRSDVGPSVRSSYTFTGTAWQSLGPLPMQSKTDAHRNWGVVGGRVDSIAIHPSNPAIMLLGSATGGIWKSTDSGATWRPVSDTAPSLATSHVTFSPANPSIVFAATGEADSADAEYTPSRSMGIYLGGGLLKSVDTGETWTRVDANLPANAILSRVAPHPTNPQVVVVGVYMYPVVAGDSGSPGGAYRSTDGGVTFTRTLEHTVSDLVQDPNEADRLLLATGGCGTCGKSGIYVSTNFGQTWNAQYTYDAGVIIGNTKLGITRTNPAVVYASFLDDKNAHIGIYRSTDAGANWTKQSIDATMCPAAGAGNNQCSYDHWITPDPVNPSTVYFGALSLYRSTDGANTWTIPQDVSTDTGTVTLHPDQHAGVVGPGGTLFVGNDGGVYRSANGGTSFTSLNATINVSQFNNTVPHPTNTEFAMGGTQDNGSQRYTGTMVWSDRIYGDGGFNLIRRDSPSQVLSAHYHAFFEFSSDGSETYTDATAYGKLMDTNTGDPLETMGFYPPAVAAAGSPASVFFGTNRVWANPSFGSTGAAWSARSAAKITNSFFTALDAPGGDPGPVWGGTKIGSVFFSTDGGATFTQRSSGLPASPVTRILSVTPDGRNAYATFAGFSGSPSKHVFRTNDAGVTWTNISSNLPDVPALAFAVDPTDPSALFVGTDVGVFRSANGGASWATFNSGLPNVPVYDLRFQASSGDLWAATFGRGVFRIKSAGGGGPGVCTPDAATMCLVGGRYKVTSHWKNQYAGGAEATLSKAKLTDVTGAFWIADASTYEYLIRFNTATNNGRVWIAIPTFTDVEFWIGVTDTQTGQTNEYHSGAGNRTLLYDPTTFVYP